MELTGATGTAVAGAAVVDDMAQSQGTQMTQSMAQ